MNLLKRAMVQSKLYEGAALLRDVEIKNFKLLGTSSTKYKEADRLQRALKMMNLEAPIKTCYILNHVIPMLIEQKDHFDLDKAIRLKNKADKLF